jgi:hypothetical protein
MAKPRVPGTLPPRPNIALLTATPGFAPIDDANRP